MVASISKEHLNAEGKLSNFSKYCQKLAEKAI